MKYQIGDILTSPYPNDSSLGLIVDKIKHDEANPFRASLYPKGYYEVLILEENSYRSWDAEWVSNNSEKIA